METGDMHVKSAGRGPSSIVPLLVYDRLPFKDHTAIE